MREKIGSIVVLIMIIMLKVTILSGQDLGKEFEGQRISKIRLEGLITSSEALVLGILKISEGDKYNPKDLQDSYDSLLELGYFKDIELRVKRATGEGVEVILVFRELPKVHSIEIVGEDDISSEIISAVMSLKPGTVFSQAAMNRDEQEILELYRSKGFYNTKVNITARQGPKGRYTNLTVQINEGDEVYIASIRIIGTKKLDPDDIYDIMLTKESGLFGGGAVLDKAKLNKDRLRIEQYMKNNGHFLGKVEYVKVNKDYIYEDERVVNEYGHFILIGVEEGPIFNMGTIKISGNTKIKTKVLREKIKVKPGTRYNDAEFKKQLNEMKALYLNQGYIQVQILPIPLIDEKNLIVSWDIEIIEGEKVHIENIRILGNNKTTTHVIDQELRIFEGEFFNFQKIQKSTNALKNLQFFKQIDPMPEAASADGLVDLNLKLTEQRTGIFNIGGGYGFLTGFTFFEEVSEKNFLGSGWLLRQKGEFGERRIGVEVGTSTSWLVPYVPILFNLTLRFLRDRINARYSLYESFADEGTQYYYRADIIETDVAIGYFIIPELQIYTGYLFSFTRAYKNVNFELTDIDRNTSRGQSLYTDLISGVAKKFLVKISHRIGLSLDYRDTVINTMQGFRIKGVITYTGGIYQGDSHWIKWHNFGSFYYNPVWKIVLAFFASYELMFKQFDGKFAVRDIDRLRFDGINELRGWRSITRDIIVGEGGKISFSFEIRFPIFESLFWGVLFADAGDITDNVGKFPHHVNYYSFGFGFRVHIPLFPIRLYFAKRGDLNRTDPDKFYFHPGLDFVFSIGGLF